MFPRILLVNTDCLANVGRPPLLKDITQILQLKRIQELFSKVASILALSETNGVPSPQLRLAEAGVLHPHI